ncbi:MAG: sugar phosphate isomerase/epimerase family protein [Brooklawnia sp.]
MWTITGFADEVSDDFAVQLETMDTLGVRFIELRSAWGVRVLDLSDVQLCQAKSMLDDAGIGVSALGTDLGKIGIDEDFGPHLERARRAIDVAWYLETADLRGFSFFMPPGADPDQYRGAVVDRLGQLVELAGQADIRYLHENEKQIFGDSPERCAELSEHFDGSSFGLILDPANYVQCGFRPFGQAYPLVGGATVYVHVKDAHLADGQVCPPGQGDAELPELIEALVADDYDGFFSIEPHLGEHDAFGGRSGPDLWQLAHRSFVELLDQAGLTYA